MNKKGDVERRRFFCDFAMNRLNNESMSLAKVVLPEPNRYFLLRVFLVAEPFAAPAIAKSSTFFPPFIAATSHLGLRPRPAQVSAGFSGLRYLGATAPLGPPRPAGLPRRAPPLYPSSFESSDSSSWRRVADFRADGCLDLAFQVL
jgi:hypothetical protein